MSFSRLTQEVGLGDVTLDEAFQRLQEFINPVLKENPEFTEWIPENWEWK
ncbi:MAG: hypothetical protein RAP03_10880 [Candidatus Electryonea clarkiae]|nr:hypothetical protein [Candidatus Electryonea clarkiae]